VSRPVRPSRGALILIALGLALALWGGAGPPRSTTFYFLLGGALSVFAGIALVLQQRRDAREMELEGAGEPEAPPDDGPARLPPPALRFDLSPEHVAAEIEDALARFEDEHAVSIDRRAIDPVIAWAAPRLGAPGQEGASARRGLLGRIESAVNRALARMQAPRRLTRIVLQDGQAVHDARFALVTAAERERLRASGAAVFAPWPREVLVGLARLPLAAAAGWLTWAAVDQMDAASWLASAVAWVSLFLAELWVRRRRGS
jgi:hypothetical protein